MIAQLTAAMKVTSFMAATDERPSYPPVFPPWNFIHVCFRRRFLLSFMAFPFVVTAEGIAKGVPVRGPRKIDFTTPQEFREVP